MGKVMMHSMFTVGYAVLFFETDIKSVPRNAENRKNKSDVRENDSIFPPPPNKIL